jgi:hypothetical protein
MEEKNNMSTELPKDELTQRYEEGLSTLKSEDRRVVTDIADTLGVFRAKLTDVVRGKGNSSTFVYQLPFEGKKSMQFDLTPQFYRVGSAIFSTDGFHEMDAGEIAEVVGRDIGYARQRSRHLLAIEGRKRATPPRPGRGASSF